MSNKGRIEQALADLAAIKQSADYAALRAVIEKGLTDRSNLVVAKAADIARQRGLVNLDPAMETAFDRFMTNAQKTDPGCLAKCALAEAMVHLDIADQAMLLRGLRHEQFEPVWGGAKDTAARLRGLCALGLVALGYKDVLYELADLLFDSDPEARQLAARAAGGTGVDAAAILLRAKIAAGNDSSDVYGECFASLLSLQPNRSLDYIARFLRSQEAQLLEAAALAIGGSRNHRAFDLLREAWPAPTAVPDARRPLMLGIAMTRQPAAVDFLLERLHDGRVEDAADAVSALQIMKSDAAITARVEAELTRLNTVTLTRRWRCS